MGSRRRRALPPPPASGLWRRVAPRLLLLVATGLLVYANSVSSPLVLDDLVSVRENPQIRELWRAAVFMPERELPIAGRPIVNATLALNYALDGTNPRGYHVVNLLFHILCSLAAFVLVRRILELPSLRPRFGEYAIDAAFAAAILWLVHPLNSEVVNYITQRTESMMALCYLLTLYAGLRALDTGGWRWPLVAVGVCLLGMGSKKSMVTAPVMVMLVDRVFVFSSWKSAFRARGWLYAGLMATWALLALLLWSGPRVYSAGFTTDVGIWTYLLNQTRMITRYLWLVLWPRPLVVYYGFPVPLRLVDVLPQAIFVVALLASTMAAFRKWPGLAFVGAWCFITLAPTSSIVPIATEVGAERRMYLPLLALIVLAVLCVQLVARRTSFLRHSHRHVVIVTLVLLLGATTFARNREYADPLTLAEVTLARWPSGVAHQMVGEQLLLAGRRTEAIAHLRDATMNAAPRAHYTLGLALDADGRTDEAIVELLEFIRLRPLLLEVPDAHVALARAYAQQERWQDATTQARLAVSKAPRNPLARAVLADLLFGQELLSEAVSAYADYLRLRPDDSDAITNVGIALIALGRLDEGIASFERAADINPGNAAARRNLAMALLDADMVDRAILAARDAIALSPNDAVPYDLLGQALARLGRLDEARTEFERALRVNPDDVDVQQHLAQVRALLAR